MASNRGYVHITRCKIGNARIGLSARASNADIASRQIAQSHLIRSNVAKGINASRAKVIDGIEAGANKTHVGHRAGKDVGRQAA